MTTAAQVLDVARSQLGVREQPPGSNRVRYSEWYGIVGPWCAMFTSWCLQQAGMPRNSMTHFAWTPAGYSAHRAAGRWHTHSPRPGDLVFYGFMAASPSRPHGISHVGIVESVEAGAIVAIEGNTDDAGSRTGGQVMRRRRSQRIVGYGRPTYAAAPAPTQEDEMKRGDKGNHVATLQKRLNAEQVVAPKLTIDANYGPDTERAVRQVQAHWGYPETGRYGIAEAERIAILTANRSTAAAVEKVGSASGMTRAQVVDLLSSLRIEVGA